MSYLTRRQQQVLSFIRVRVDVEGVAPTLQEISDAFGFSSTASAQKHVLLLEKKGFLRREKHQKRGLVLEEEAGPANRATAYLPLLGVVAAGSPIESIAGDERVGVPRELLRSGEHYVLKVRGDSMIEEGVHDGDLVVVESRETALPGEMVVALVSGEATLKRWYRHGSGALRLQPSNASMPPLIVAEDQVRLQGVVVGLLRRY